MVLIELDTIDDLFKLRNKIDKKPGIEHGVEHIELARRFCQNFFK